MTLITTNTLLLILLLLILGIVVFEVWQFRHRLQISSTLVSAATPYTSSRTKGVERVLVAGDSTAVGVGAANPELSIAGRLQEIYPDVSIDVVGKSGYKAAQLLAELEKIDSSYDLILLQIGGNDIIRFTNLSQLERTIEQLFTQAKRLSDTQILMTSGNVGLAPFFPFPLTSLYTYRTLQVRELFASTAKEYGIVYVDLFEKRKDDPFARDPEKYYATDMLHPSGEGYALWFEKLQQVLPSNL